MVKVRGQDRGVNVRIMIGCHNVRVKVGGQGQGIGHGVKSGEGSRFGGQGQGSRSGVKVRVMIGGHKVSGQVLCHDWLSQGWGSRSVVKVRV